MSTPSFALPGTFVPNLGLNDLGMAEAAAQQTTAVPTVPTPLDRWLATLAGGEPQAVGDLQQGGNPRAPVQTPSLGGSTAWWTDVPRIATAAIGIVLLIAALIPARTIAVAAGLAAAPEVEGARLARRAAR